MKALDLSFDADLSVSHSKIFNNLAKSKIKSFNKIIGKLYQNINQEKFLLWIISNTSTRNPYNSKIFYYYLSYYFLKKILAKDKFKIIIVDSSVQKKIYERLIKRRRKNITIILKKKSFNNKVRFLKFFFRFLIIKISKLIDKKKKISKKPSLIMTYVLDGYVLKSRYFPNLFEKIKKKKNIFFVPNIAIFKISSFIKNLILLRRENSYLLKEDYISILDIFSILILNSKIKNFFKKNIFIEDFFLTEIVEEEILNQKNTFITLESYLNYLFLKKLKSRGIDLKTSIVWFENQPFERSWSYAMNMYHKKSNNLGYMGIVSADMYISQDHTLPEDRKFHTVPKLILTIGNYFKNSIKKYDSKLKTKAVSALSFQHLFKKKKINKKNQILVALPILKNDSENIIKICKNLMNYKKLSKFDLLIRPHPTTNSNYLEKELNNLNIKNVKIDYNENFFDSLMQSKFFFGGMSSTSLEALIFDVPTVIYKSNDYLSSTCIPKFINKKFYIHSNDFKKIIKFIFKSNNQKKLLLDKVRNNCFKSISNNLIKEFKL